MIVPHERLLWFVGFLIPAAVLSPLDSGVRWFLLMAGLILALVAMADAILCRGLMSGLTLEIASPQRLTQGREGILSVLFRDNSGKTRLMRVGLAFPAKIQSPMEWQNVRLDNETAMASLNWPCTASHRGRYVLQGLSAEQSSRLGLWQIRRRFESPTEIRVYPNLEKDQKRLSALFLNRGLMGTHRQPQVGQGREFEKLRDYIPGDPTEDIHWKSTAKRMRPVTKLYQVERSQEVYVILDHSRLSARIMEHQSTLERFIASAHILQLTAERQGDRFGLITFADRVGSLIKPNRGKTHFGACRDQLYTLEPKIVSPDYRELFAFIRTRLSRRSLLVVLTQLEDPTLAEEFLNSVQVVSGHHLVIVGMISPDLVKPLYEGKAPGKIDDLYQKLGGHMAWTSLRELEKIMAQRKVKLHTLENELAAVQLVSHYLALRQRQAL